MLGKSNITKIENKIRERTAIWEKCGILDRLEPEVKNNLSILLENQKLHDEGMESRFKRLSIPLVSRIFRSLKVHELVSVQAMLEKQWLVRWFDGNDLIREPIQALSRNTKTCWYGDMQIDTHKDYMSLDGELATNMAKEIKMGIDREILQDLLNVAPRHNHNFIRTETTIREAYTDLREKVLSLANDMEKNKGANWIITSPEISALFEKDLYFEPSEEPIDVWNTHIEIMRVGTLGKKFKVYKNPLFPINSILLGYKGEHPYDAGYFYCPYLMLDLGERDDAFGPRPIKMSYAKKLRFDADEYYSRIILANFTV